MAHKEVLNKHKVEILTRMYRHLLATGRNEIPLSILRDDINAYNNAQKLRYHALIFKVKRGTWAITSHGLDFLKGTRELPKHLYIEDNAIKARSDELVNIRQVNQGQVVIQNTFEYVVDGKPVGVRPVEHVVVQERLL